MICRSCKKDKDRSDFTHPAGSINSGWPKGYTVMCISCVKRHRLNPKTVHMVENNYKKLCDGTVSKHNNDLQEALWDKLEEKLGDDFDIDGDSTTFTESQACDNMMQRYEDDLIKVLSGLEDKLPDWYGLETEEEDN